MGTPILSDLEGRKPPNPAGALEGPPAPGLRPLPVRCLPQKDLKEDLSQGGGVRSGGGHEKVSPSPTWAVFALSGLAAWLIDNWPPHKSICFFVNIHPRGDISNVPPLFWAMGARQECGALGSALQSLKTTGPGEKPGLGVWDAGAGRVSGPKSWGRRRQAQRFPHASRLRPAGLVPRSCSQPAAARTKGRQGATDRVRLGARGEGRRQRGAPPPKAWDGLLRRPRSPRACQAKKWQCVPVVGWGPSHTHTHTHQQIVKPKGLALADSHQKALRGACLTAGVCPPEGVGP